MKITYSFLDRYEGYLQQVGDRKHIEAQIVYILHASGFDGDPLACFHIHCWNWYNSNETGAGHIVDVSAIFGTASSHFGIVYHFGNNMLLVGVWTLTATIQLLAFVAY